MATSKVLYALRIPTDLKRLIDMAAKSGGVSTSQLVVDACWKYIEQDPAPAMFGGSIPIGSTLRTATGLTPASLRTAQGITPSFDYQETGLVEDVRSPSVLLSIPGIMRASDLGTPKADAVKAAMPSPSAIAEPELPPCPYTEYDTDTGESYGCRLRQHPAKIKHVRGPAL